MKKRLAILGLLLVSGSVLSLIYADAVKTDMLADHVDPTDAFTVSFFTLVLLLIINACLLYVVGYFMFRPR